MSEPIAIGPVFAKWEKRFAALCEDDEFWIRKEAELKAEEEKEAQASERRRQEMHERRMKDIPQRYRELFDPTKAKYSMDIVRKVRDWEPSNSDGIGLVGKTGLGKTRLLTARLRNLRCSWLYLPAAKISDLVKDSWSDDYLTANVARVVMDDARNVRVLMLDDIGDEKTTDAVSEEMKDLIETRTSRGRPILWTSNLTEDQITKRHGTRGAAIVRRLAEFSWTP